MPSSSQKEFGFSATGIGSVPFSNMEETCREILRFFPSMPFWPQFVRLSYREDMLLQFTEGLPLLEVNEQKRSVSVSSSGNTEYELASFYERFLADELESFAISRQFAPGLHMMLELIESDFRTGGGYVKGQIVGPFTFAAGVSDPKGIPVLHNPELFEAMTSGLCAKALWQVKRLAKSGRYPVLFLDEPYLAGFGSAFCTIQREQVTETLGKLIRYLKDQSDVLVGIHCCGNTDWAMLLEAGPDIINFDAFGYMNYFLLYPKQIAKFLTKGGTIAWGIVPTSGFTGDENARKLIGHLTKGIKDLCKHGLEENLVRRQSLLTPACGMGSMEPERARMALGVLAEISEIVRG